VSDGGQVHSGGDREQDEEVVETSGEDAAEARDVVDDVDDLLDEIDDVLEENAEEFVRNYVQKGGQ
jgi:ubiquitin-like protein Pup